MDVEALNLRKMLFFLLGPVKDRLAVVPKATHCTCCIFPCVEGMWWVGRPPVRVSVRTAGICHVIFACNSRQEGHTSVGQIHLSENSQNPPISYLQPNDLRENDASEPPTIHWSVVARRCAELLPAAGRSQAPQPAEERRGGGVREGASSCQGPSLMQEASGHLGGRFC